jgi:hypothetical protein
LSELRGVQVKADQASDDGVCAWFGLSAFLEPYEEIRHAATLPYAAIVLDDLACMSLVYRYENVGR